MCAGFGRSYEAPNAPHYTYYMKKFKAVVCLVFEFAFQKKYV